MNSKTERVSGRLIAVYLEMITPYSYIVLETAPGKRRGFVAAANAMNSLAGQLREVILDEEKLYVNLEVDWHTQTIINFTSYRRSKPAKKPK